MSMRHAFTQLTSAYPWTRVPSSYTGYSKQILEFRHWYPVRIGCAAALSSTAVYHTATKYLLECLAGLGAMRKNSAPVRLSGTLWNRSAVPASQSAVNCPPHPHVSDVFLFLLLGAGKEGWLSHRVFMECFCKSVPVEESSKRHLSFGVYTPELINVECFTVFHLKA